MFLKVGVGMDKKKMKGDKCNFLLLFSSFIVHIVYKAFYFVDNTYALKSLLFLYIFKNIIKIYKVSIFKVIK